jgi:hypothetical protein
MKRPFASVLTLGLILGFCHAATADEAADFLKYYGWWEGEWEVEGKVGDEVQTSEMVIERHAPACLLVKWEGISIWGYDPAKKQWVGSGFGLDGSRFTALVDRPKGQTIEPGDVHKSQGEAWQPDGTKVISETTWKYIDENKAELRQTSKTEDGQALPEVVTSCTRKVRR